MSDWLKVEKQTPNKPEIIYLARKLGISRGEAFLSWFLLYAWADGITTDGSVPLLSGQEIDTVSGATPGTCAALADNCVDWVRIFEDKIVFQKWDRHNGRSSKARALDTEKKRRQRAKGCPDFVPSKTGPEKRREEYKKEIYTKKEKAAPFTPPTVEEVRSYCNERKNGIDPERFIAFYESKDWRVGKNKMANWKAAVITWERNRPAVGQPLTDEELENFKLGDFGT